MRSFVEVFAVRVPYLLGNEYVAGFLAQKLPYVEGEDETYRRGLKDCATLVSTCKQLRAQREYIGYYRMGLNARLKGFRPLDFLVRLDGTSVDPDSAKTFAREVVVLRARSNFERPVSLAAFKSIERVVIFRPCPGRCLSDLLKTETWPKQASELELHFDSSDSTVAVDLEIDRVLPVRKLTICGVGNRSYEHLKLSGLATWPLLEEIIIEADLFLDIASFCDTLHLLPHLRILRLELGMQVHPTRQLWHTPLLPEGLKGLKRLEKVVIHFWFKERDRIWCKKLDSIPSVAFLAWLTTRLLKVPDAFVKWHTTEDIPFKCRYGSRAYEPGHCYQTIKGPVC